MKTLNELKLHTHAAPRTWSNTSGNNITKHVVFDTNGNELPITIENIGALCEHYYKLNAEDATYVMTSALIESMALHGACEDLNDVSSYIHRAIRHGITLRACVNIEHELLQRDNADSDAF